VPLSGFVLRACELRDLDQVTEVEKASFQDRPYSRSDFVSCLLTAQRGFIVACRDASVIGYVISVSQGHEGFIQSIAVLPAFRQEGVGEALMKSALDHLTVRCRWASLLVDVNNKAAIRLYRKFSFSETGRIIEGYYPNGDDAIEMANEL